jgi:hypothetical protein
MGKKEKHKEELVNLLTEYLFADNQKRLLDYLIFQSNLPGRRANLELAEAFGDIVRLYCDEHSEKLWRLCKDMSQISEEEASTNEPEEFIPFCGIIGISTIASIKTPYFEDGLFMIKEAAKDGRWRIREAVAMGIQRLLTNNPEKTLVELQKWLLEEDYYIWRAVIAGLAEPEILRDKKIARVALEYHQEILEELINKEESKSESYQKLKQALEYTLSVVVEQIPREGFKLMLKYVSHENRVISRIIKANLKKSRLLKKYPEEVARVQEIMERRCIDENKRTYRGKGTLLLLGKRL